MSIKHRILATVAAGTMVASIGLAAAPAGAGDLPIGIPRPCTHGCDGGGGAPDGPGDLTSADFDPPTEHPQGSDTPVVADATFTG